VKVGDLVQTVKGWSYKTWMGVILEEHKNMFRILWTEANNVEGSNIWWCPKNKVELLSASR
jgi:hypothetical protein